MKPGCRPTKATWCKWVSAIVEWTPEQRALARERADRAYGTRSIRVPYAALSEMRALDRAEGGVLVHAEHCTKAPSNG